MIVCCAWEWSDIWAEWVRSWPHDSPGGHCHHAAPTPLAARSPTRCSCKATVAQEVRQRDGKGHFFIFSIYHFTKKKKKKCEFDPQVIPLSTCLFVTAGGFTLPITAWCHSLSRVRIKLSWTWGLLFFAELCIQLFPGFVPPLHYLVQWWMVLHLCWSLVYLRRSSAFSFSVESIRLVCQRSFAKSDIAQVRESLLWSVRH